MLGHDFGSPVAGCDLADPGLFERVVDERSLLRRAILHRAWAALSKIPSFTDILPTRYAKDLPTCFPYKH